MFQHNELKNRKSQRELKDMEVLQDSPIRVYRENKGNEKDAIIEDRMVAIFLELKKDKSIQLYKKKNSSVKYDESTNSTL